MATDTSAESLLQRSVAIAALGTFTVANATGLWLASLLLWPKLGTIAGPLTYGRWMPVHLDMQLFGWCSLPAIGLLLRRMLPRSLDGAIMVPLALTVWCGALAAGAASWLSGGASGKLFLSWKGPAAFAFTGAQLFLWGVLVAGVRARWREGLDGSVRRALDSSVLGLLLLVPIALHLAAQPQVYPPVNPHSGGATGHSLLASSLGIVGIGLVLPFLFDRNPVSVIRRPAITVASVYVLNWMVYGTIGHGNVSNRDALQIAGLSTLLVWPPLLVGWFRKFEWEESQRRWLLTSALWAAFLVVDGLVLFLPSVLEGAKFTHSIVAHAHLAMAGLLTSLNLLMLISLAPGSKLAHSLAGRGPWLAWNLACLGMVVVLTLLGWIEGGDPLLVPYGGRGVQTIYVLRLIFGTIMAAAGFHWLTAAIRNSIAAKRATNPTGTTPPAHAHVS